MYCTFPEVNGACKALHGCHGLPTRGSRGSVERHLAERFVKCLESRSIKAKRGAYQAKNGAHCKALLDWMLPWPQQSTELLERLKRMRTYDSQDFDPVVSPATP